MFCLIHIRFGCGYCCSSLFGRRGVWRQSSISAQLIATTLCHTGGSCAVLFGPGGTFTQSIVARDSVQFEYHFVQSACTHAHTQPSATHIYHSHVKLFLMAVRALDLFAHVREGRVAGHRGAPSVIRAVIEPKARPTPHFVLRSHTHTRRARARPRARAKIKLHFRLPAITMESATARSAPGQSAARPHSPPAPAERARGCRVGLCSGSL